MLFDALKLLGSMAESQSAPSAANRFGAAVQQEVQRVMGKLDEHGHNSGARDFVASKTRCPTDIAGLVGDVATPQEAVEVYAASLMAVEVDTQAERDYLADLAAALRLPQPVAQSHPTLLGTSA